MNISILVIWICAVSVSHWWYYYQMKRCLHVSLFKYFTTATFYYYLRLWSNYYVSWNECLLHWFILFFFYFSSIFCLFYVKIKTKLCFLKKNAYLLSACEWGVSPAIVPHSYNANNNRIKSNNNTTLSTKTTTAAAAAAASVCNLGIDWRHCAHSLVLHRKQWTRTLCTTKWNENNTLTEPTCLKSVVARVSDQYPKPFCHVCNIMLFICTFTGLVWYSTPIAVCK